MAHGRELTLRKAPSEVLGESSSTPKRAGWRLLNFLYLLSHLVYHYPTMRVVEKAQLMSASEIDRTLQRVAHEIVERSGGTKHLALIGIVRRGVPLAQRIAQAMRGIDGVDVPVGILDITLYRDDLSKVAPQAVLRSSDIPFGVDNMDLVLIDDVLYTGRTIRAAMNGLFDLGRPKRVSLCVLIDRGHREMPIEAQYIGRTVQTSDTEIIEVRLNEIDKEERVVLVDRVES
jgi:pyrimidine operon attenuation protein/uracil phosphoribosyltransferase